MQTQPRHTHTSFASTGDEVAEHASFAGQSSQAGTHGLPAQPATASWQLFAWDQLTLDELVAFQRTLRLAIEAKRKRAGELRKQQTGPQRARKLPDHLHGDEVYYKAKVASVGPAALRDSLQQIDRCILGVSLGGGNAAMFQGAKLEASVRWIASRARHCRVLVGDSMGRISLQVRYGMDPETAEREALALGRRYAAEAEAVFRHYSDEDVTFEICYSSHTRATPPSPSSTTRFAPFTKRMHRCAGSSIRSRTITCPAPRAASRPARAGASTGRSSAASICSRRWPWSPASSPMAGP